MTLYFDVTCSSNKTSLTYVLWRHLPLQLVRTLEGHSGSVNVVAVTGPHFAVTGSGDITVKVWNLVTGQLVRTLEGHSRYVFAVMSTPLCLRRYVYAVMSSPLCLRRYVFAVMSTPLCLRRYVYAVMSTPLCLRRYVFAVMSTLSPWLCRTYVSGSEDNTVKVWVCI